MTTATPGRARVVVGVDGSAESEHALRWAAHLADTVDGDLEAVMAWPSQLDWAWALPMIPDWNPNEDAAKQLELSLEHVFGDAIPTALRRTVVEGNAAKALLDASRGATVLVVGSRGHGGFAGLLLGSVSAACAERAECPVLVVHGNSTPPARSAAGV